jgi:hypothetical protein
MCSSLYIGLWCECFLFFIYHIQKIKIKLFFLDFTTRFLPWNLHVLIGFQGPFKKIVTSSELEVHVLELEYRDRFFLAYAFALLTIQFVITMH